MGDVFKTVLLAGTYAQLLADNRANAASKEKKIRKRISSQVDELLALGTEIRDASIFRDAYEKLNLDIIKELAAREAGCATQRCLSDPTNYAGRLERMTELVLFRIPGEQTDERKAIVAKRAKIL